MEGKHYLKNQKQSKRLKDKKKEAAEKKGSLVKVLLPLIFILPAVFIAFSPILKNELTNWDDPELILENPFIRSLSFENIKHIFTTFYFGNYQPLHLLSYAVEYHFWKLDPVGYHTVSLVLFLMITSLVYYFIYLISNKNRTIAVIGALLFAINPMRVESVAWAAERKDMLYALFYTAGLITYVKYLVRRDDPGKDLKVKFLVYTFLLFILSVFSKVMAVSFVGTMVMLDYLYARKISLRMVLEKVPFVIVSFIIGITQVRATASTNTIDKSNLFSFSDRLLIVARNFMFYFYKMLVPVNLSTFHPYPERPAGVHWPMEFYIAPFFILVLILLMIWSFRKTRIIVFSIGFMFVSLALVLQYIAIGPAMFNERYSLIPAIAFSFAVASGIYYLVLKFPKGKYFFMGVTGLYLLAMLPLTFNRCGVWKTSLTLWNDVLDQYPKVATALNNRGKYYGKDLGDLVKARTDLDLSIKYDPYYPNAYSNRGIIFCMQGKFDSAIADFNTCIRLPGNHFDAQLNRAIAYAQTHHPDLALEDFNKCVELEPGKTEAVTNRGVLLLYMNQPEKALADFNTAIRLNPDDPDLYVHRSHAFYNLGKYREALQDLHLVMNSGRKVDESFYNQVKNSLNK